MIDSAAIAKAMGASSDEAANQSDFDSSKIIAALESSSAPKQRPPIDYSQKISMDEMQGSDDPIGQALAHYGSSVIAAPIAGIAGIGSAIGNLSLKAGADTVNKVSNALTIEPKSDVANSIVESKANPMNWPGIAGKYAGGKLADSGYPKAATAVDTAIEGLPAILGLKEALRPKAELNLQGSLNKSSPATESISEPAQLTAAKIHEEAPAEPAQLTAADVKDKAAILQRIGLDKVRENVLKGDKFGSAIDYQISRSPESAGQAARDQLQSERTALENHANDIVKNTGGSLGVDEGSLHARGSAIAEPFDAYRDYFKREENNLYKKADEQSNGLPVVKTENLESLLNDRTFKNTLMAQKQEPLLNAMKDQLENFKETNPNGLTVKNAEQMRQWINQNWNHENSGILKQVKSALDDDVFGSAGSDIYAAGRAMHQLKAKTLDNPNGISKLFDQDPYNPVNRTTPQEKIPDTIYRLPLDQFKNVIDTIRKMPEELQPKAEQAIKEIKAHAANQIADIGAKTQTQWNARGVNDFIKKNGEKLDYIFDSPEEVRKIADLQSAGNLLRVETSYPGAAAQTQQFLKRGIGSSLITPAAAVSGEALASLLGIPMGLGGAGGAMIGNKISVIKAEKAAAQKFNKSITNLNDITQVKK